MFTCVSSFAQGQALKKEEHKKDVEHVENISKPTSNTIIHKFLCRRCGSENQVKWSFPGKNKHLELIPHCGFCGKKYWPKFKPTGMLERTYCRAVGEGNYQAGMVN
jgi:transcription elongation factor Elf1